MSKEYFFEMPFDMIFDSQKERMQGNIKNVGNIKGSSQQYSGNAIKRNTMGNVKLAKKSKSKSLHILNNEKEGMKTYATCNSLKNSEKQNGFVINTRTEFEEKLWEDIKGVYNDLDYKVDIEYYERAMPLQ